MQNDSAHAADNGNGLKLLLSWTFVGVPLLWGVSLTLINAVKLFR